MDATEIEDLELHLSQACDRVFTIACKMQATPELEGWSKITARLLSKVHKKSLSIPTQARVCISNVADAIACMQAAPEACRVTLLNVYDDFKSCCLIQHGSALHDILAEYSIQVRVDSQRDIDESF